MTAATAVRSENAHAESPRPAASPRPSRTRIRGTGVYTLYFDGLCEPRNPGGWACYGWLLADPNGMVIKQAAGVVSHGPSATNNVAEWSALGFGLKCLVELNEGLQIDHLEIRGDSQLVIRQLTGEYQCRNAVMAKCRDRCYELLTIIGGGTHFIWIAKWIPREQNEAADALSRQAYEDATGQRCPDRGRRWRSR